jgi:hypothetical protein
MHPPETPDFRLFQIVYDERTLGNVSPGFRPLWKDEPDDGWFEFSAILEFLRNTDLDPECWYGFFSTRFSEKTRFRADDIEELVKSSPNAQVALFSSYWDKLAIWRNPWLQGEYFHSGVLYESQKFISELGYDLDLRSVVTDFSVSVYSNYVVAKPAYWAVWKDLAEEFLKYSDKHLPSATTSYNCRQHPLHVFIQERLASLILLSEDFVVVHADYIKVSPIRKGPNGQMTRALLKACNRGKSEYRRGSHWAILIFFSARVALITNSWIFDFTRPVRRCLRRFSS